MLTNLQQWKSNQNCDSLSLFLSQLMMSLSQQFGGLKCLPLSTSTLSRKFISRSFAKQKQFNGCHAARRIVAKAVAIRNAETKERLKLKEMFAKAYERCLTAPMEGVCFTLEDFHSALHKFNFNSEIGAKVKGIVFSTDASGAIVDITAKSSAHLPLCETSILDIKHVEEAGILPGLREVFVVVGKNEEGDSLILSLRAIQNELAWERCRQLHAEDVIVKGKIVGANKGGVVAVVEGLRGFVPFSHISAKSAAEELFDKELPLKFVEVDEDQVRLVLSNRKAMADNQAQLGVGSVVSGTVQSIKPYGAFIDIGGINGLLHVSQISHDRVQDIATVLQPGNILKVMILSHDHERGRVSLSTKKLEPTPGDMIRNPELVFEKAEGIAETFRQRIAQAEAMARVDILSFQAKSGLTLNSEGIFGPPSSELPAQGLDLNDILSAEDP